MRLSLSYSDHAGSSRDPEHNRYSCQSEGPAISSVQDLTLIVFLFRRDQDHIRADWSQPPPRDFITSLQSPPYFRAPPIACFTDGKMFAYPFFGSRRQYRVCQPMYVESPDWLTNYLKEKNVRLVAARPGRPLR